MLAWIRERERLERLRSDHLEDLLRRQLEEAATREGTRAEEYRREIRALERAQTARSNEDSLLDEVRQLVRQLASMVRPFASSQVTPNAEHSVSRSDDAVDAERKRHDELTTTTTALPQIRDTREALRHELTGLRKDTTLWRDRTDAAIGDLRKWLVRQGLLRHVEAAIAASIPGGCTVLMAGLQSGEFIWASESPVKGFPLYRASDPATQASSALEALRAAQLKDRTYLVVPTSSLHRLDELDELREYLEKYCSLTWEDALCRIYDVGGSQLSRSRRHARWLRPKAAHSDRHPTRKTSPETKSVTVARPARRLVGLVGSWKRGRLVDPKRMPGEDPAGGGRPKSAGSNGSGNLSPPAANSPQSARPAPHASNGAGEQPSRRPITDPVTGESLLPLRPMGEAASAEHYARVVDRVREMVDSLVPPGQCVAVASRGDDQLVAFPRHQGLHFPQSREGGYCGYHPGGNTAAVAQLEWIRSRGVRYLLLPETALWWLDFYPGFRQLLEQRYRTVAVDRVAGIVYDLRPHADVGHGGTAGMAAVMAELRNRLGRDPFVLDWDTGLELQAAFPSDQVFSAPTFAKELLYVDETIDCIVVPDGHAAKLADARRVATTAVVAVRDGLRGSEPKLKVEWLKEGVASKMPSVSIVIASYNTADHTEACLRSVLETMPLGFEVEVLVVDDGSRDDSVRMVRRWTRRDSRVRLVRNFRNRGYIRTVNRGAREAEGDYLVFLNSDTILPNGWLEPLIRTLRTMPDAGVVGCKLVYPDGILQEAGGLIFSDGSGANFGRGNYNPDAPLFDFVREADYCSGAVLATPRTLFSELGGFDELFLPAYYEDPDYYFQVRAHGLRGYYQPESVVIHVEGGTHGTDENVGVKRYQAINRGKFVSKWCDALRAQPTRPDHFGPDIWADLALWRREGLNAGAG